MRKIVCILLFLLISVCSVTAFAEEAVFETAGDLYQYWEENDAYPDYVSGVWSTDGGITNLTIGVLDTEEGNAGKAKILALVKNNATVTFAYGARSYNELTDVMDRLMPYFEQDRGLVSGGVDVMTGTVRLGIHEERKDDPETIAMLEEMRQTFGDVFTVEYTGLVYTLVDTEVAVDAVTYTDPRVFFAVAAAVVLLAALTTALVLKKRQMAVVQTSTGETVEADARLTKSEVEYAVKNDAEAPSDALKQRVLDKIEKA